MVASDNTDQVLIHELAALAQSADLPDVPTAERFERSTFIRKIGQTTAPHEVLRGILLELGVVDSGIYIETQFGEFAEATQDLYEHEIDEVSGQDIPEDAVIRAALKNFKEAMDNFRGSFFDDLVKRTERLGLFVVEQAVDATQNHSDNGSQDLRDT